MRPIFLALMFACELVAWAGIGWSAYVLAQGGPWAAALAVVSVVVVLVVWGRFAAPRAPASDNVRFAVRTGVFTLAVIALAYTGHREWATTLAFLVVLSGLGAHLTRDKASGPPAR